MIFLLVDRNHFPSLAVENELGAAYASTRDKVLVERSDSPFPEKVEHRVLLNIRDNGEILKIVLDSFRISRGVSVAELSYESELFQQMDCLVKLDRFKLPEWVGSTD